MLMFGAQVTEGFPRRFGKYHLLAPLAQGGMGALYLAITGDAGLEKLCVIKTVLPHLADKEYLQRFRDEAKVVVKLTHSNLVPVFDAGQADGTIFLAMEYVEGKDLRAVWNRCAKKGVAFPMDVAVFIAKELARGLGYAHSFAELKLVHRDVSPPNTLVSFNGEVKLTDFGLASSTLKLEKTAPGVIYGKVSYMAPEQARGEPLDGRTDLYAAGIILWELLTGRQLFPPGQQQPTELLGRAKDPTVEPPSKRAARVPPALDAIVLKCLATERDARYQTGEEMRAALAGWLATEAPATDGARLEQFVSGLFAEDIAKERAERQALIEETRTKIYTIFPNGPGGPGSEVARGDDRRQTGRRATDLGLAPDTLLTPPAGAPALPGRPAPVPLRASTAPAARAATDRPGDERRGAVNVPFAGPNARTMITPPLGEPLRAPSEGEVSGANAIAALAEPGDSVGVIGQVIDGRYAVRALIGEGGMGRVYEAEHVEIGKRVALKILHPVYSRTPEVVARFRREARAASKIGHPNIVDVTDSGTTADGSVYFVMEFLDGVELAAVIDREGALPVPRVLAIGTQICRALAAAHNAGIVHRDLKPENVLLVVREGTTDFVKVLDFGIAKSAELEETRKERLTHPGMAMGTPEYMAPEQAAGKPADSRSDVYAVGAILYEMLTGRPPYEGENFMAILTKKATLDPVAPRAVRPDLPQAVEDVVMRALARDPAVRPQSMEALEYELTKCLAGRGVAVAKVLGMPVDASLLGAGAAEPAGLSAQGSVTRTGHPGTGQHRAITPHGMPAGSSQRDLSLELEPVNERVSRGIWGSVLAFVAIGVVIGGAAWAYFTYWREEKAGVTATDIKTEEGVAPMVVPDAAPAPAPTPTPRHRPERKDPAREMTPERPKKDDPKPESKKDGLDGMVDEARGLAAAGKVKKARALYEKLADSETHKAKGLLGLATLEWESGDNAAATKLAKKALDAGGGDDARMILGNAATKAGKFDTAIKWYEEILAANPKHKGARIALDNARAEKARRKPR